MTFFALQFVPASTSPAPSLPRCPSLHLPSHDGQSDLSSCAAVRVRPPTSALYLSFLSCASSTFPKMVPNSRKPGVPRPATISRCRAMFGHPGAKMSPIHSGEGEREEEPAGLPASLARSLDDARDILLNGDGDYSPVAAVATAAAVDGVLRGALLVKAANRGVLGTVSGCELVHRHPACLPACEKAFLLP